MSLSFLSSLSVLGRNDGNLSLVALTLLPSTSLFHSVPVKVVVVCTHSFMLEGDFVGKKEESTAQRHHLCCSRFNHVAINSTNKKRKSSTFYGVGGGFSVYLASLDVFTCCLLFPSSLPCVSTP